MKLVFIALILSIHSKCGETTWCFGKAILNKYLGTPKCGDVIVHPATYRPIIVTPAYHPVGILDSHLHHSGEVVQTDVVTGDVITGSMSDSAFHRPVATYCPTCGTIY
ncbi:hypothetical protein WA026_021809 [Henosepilachna vigintioctopunctata]|uniref:Uncharacterized protein n=1 Tax=Henosepilachna vigintioctopunctata TaxID=420089 RepID=A0AAW1TY24_9CUCU